MWRAMQSAAEQIYGAAIEAVSPHRLVTCAVSFNPATKILTVAGRSLSVDRNVKVVAFGKAVLGMVAAVEGILGEHVLEGVASVPVGAMEGAQRLLPHCSIPSKTRVYEGAMNNLPDASAASAAQDILRLVRAAGPGDVLLVLMSGGGSSLLPCPVEGVTLLEKRMAVELVSRSGGSIEELNTVRKALSLVKGGKLAETAYPAKVLSLILSDVVGDPLAVISSGPTVPHEAHLHQDALRVIHKHSLEDKVPPSVLKYLQDSTTSHTPRVNAGADKLNKNEEFCHVHNVVIGNNRVATKAAASVTGEMGYQTLVWSHHIQGEARIVAAAYARLFHSLAIHPAQKDTGSLLDEQPFLDLFDSYPSLREDFASVIRHFTTYETHQQPLCLISAGEPTVSVKGRGRGGRNQELALAFAMEMSEVLQRDSLRPHTSNSESHFMRCKKWLFFSVGTDGQDGPCDAAGAMVTEAVVSAALEEGLNPREFLVENNSYGFFTKLSQGSFIIKTGLTGTNVMDLHVLLVQ